MVIYTGALEDKAAEQIKALCDRAALIRAALATCQALVFAVYCGYSYAPANY
jgi:hypothetical protein